MRFATTSLRSISSRGSFWVLACFLLSAVYVSYQAFANSGGGIGSDVTANGSNAGCSCHCTNSNNNTTVTISSTETKFTAGKTYNFTVTVENSNQKAGGVMVSATNGTLAAGDDGLKKPTGASYLVHSNAKTLKATWSFTFTPTNSGSATIYATGNAVNSDGGNGGGNCTDQWNHATNYSITVDPVSTDTKGIAIGRTAIDLGKIRVGGRKADSIKISSNGNQTLTVSSTSMKNGTHFSRFPSTNNRTISAGSHVIDSVIAQPTSRGQFSDSLIINSDATTTADQRKAVYVIAQGIQGVLGGDATLTFANQRVNTSKTKAYVITNTGDDTLFLNNATISGDGYSITAQPTRLNLGPNEKDSVIIQFTPNAKQTFNGTLTTSAKEGVNGQSVTITGLGTAPAISIPSTTSIGSIRVNQTTQGGVIIKNTGDDTLHITNIALTGGATQRFSVFGPTSFDLAPSAQKTVLMSYSPLVADIADSAKVTITSDDLTEGSKVITIFGMGTIPKMRNFQTDTLSFGSVKVGATGTANFRVDNLGSDALVISSASVSPSQFAVTNKPFSIQAGGTGYFTMSFAPTATGTVTGMVVITGDDPQNLADTIYVKGSGTNSALSVPSGIDFKDLNVSSSKDSEIVLTNSGTAPVVIYAYKLSAPNGGFHLTDTSAHVIGANETIKVKVNFIPLLSIDYFASLDIVTDDISAPIRTVNLSGRGIKGNLILNVDGTTTTNINFGTIDTNKTVSKRVVVRNTGSAPSTVLAATLTGSSRFTLTPSPITNQQIAAGDSLAMTVSFTPLNDILQSATLTITTTEGSVPFTVQFQGIGKIQIPVNSVRPERILPGWSMALMPNPTRSQTTVILRTKEAAEVSIGVFDLAGKQVQMIDRGMLSVGEHQVRVNAGSLPSGEYFVRAIAKGRVAAETRMIVQH